MGQRADQIGQYGQQAGKDGGQDNAGKPEEIRAQIEQTRNEMSETINAIQERLSPGQIKEHAKAAVREATIGRAEDMVNNAEQTAKGFGSGLMETIKQNPIPAAIAGASIAWLFTHKSNGGSQSQAGSYYGYPASRHYSQYGQGIGDYDHSHYNAGSGPGEMAKRATGKVGDFASNATDQVGQVMSGTRDQVGNMVGGAANQVGNIASGAADQVGNLAGGTRLKAEEVTNSFQRTLMGNPLAVGAAAVAVGAVVGLMLPETRQEHELLGEARDNLMSKAQSTLQDTMHKVQHVADEAQNAVKMAAENQGLTQQT